MAQEVMQRTFAVSVEDASPCSPWESGTFLIAGDSVSALRSLVADHYPRRRIAELLGYALVAIMAPIAFVVEAEIKDRHMNRERALELLKVILAAATVRLPALNEAVKLDPGYRASYMWDEGLGNFAIHVVCPNTYRQASELHAAFKNIHLPTAPLSAAYKGFVLQDKVLGCSRAVPIYMGESYTVIQTNAADDSFVISCARPQIKLTSGEIVVGPRKLLSRDPVSARDFGGMPVWLVPIEHTVEFFIRMIRARCQDYDDICCDVLYHECGMMPEDFYARVIGRRPRSGMKERSVRFLYWIAKRVCPDEYRHWMYEQSAILAHQFSTEAITDELFHRLFLLNLEGEFISIVEGRDNRRTLYYFKNIWHVDKEMDHLTKAISRIMTLFVGRDLREYMQGRDQMDIYKVMLNEATRLNYMSTTRAHTVRAVARMLNENIHFDEDPNLLGCNNAVIELNDRGAMDRPGRPEDLISMSTHLHYQKFTLAECQDVEQLFEKLFAEPVTRNWFFLVLCSLLWGINAERQYYILFGCARNGKSGILNMLELVLGDYFGRFSSKALNERNDPSATSPELAAMGGKRAMVTSELKAGSQMEADILKALTGDDGLSVRGLYQDPRVLRMMAKILIASNHFPGFLNADKALRDRTVLIPLVALFDSLGAPADEFEQIKQRHFPADRNFRSTIQKIAPKLLFMLVDRYAQYKEVGLEPKPPAVKALTDGYWHAVGVQSRFILDCLGFDDGSKPEEILPAVATPTQHAQVVAPSVLPVAAPPARSKLTHTQAYNRFTGWAITRKMDITKYPLFTFKSLMDSELASMREHRIEFALDGWIGCFVKA